MVKRKKLWAHYEQVKFILGFYITLFFFVPFSTFCISFLVHSKEIDTVAQEGITLAVQGALKWYAIIMPIITVLFIIWFLFYSDTVEFTDTSIKYYRWLFSKSARNISYNQIAECVLAGRLWNNKRKRTRGRKIILFNKSIIAAFDIYSKLALMLALNLDESKFRLVGDNGNLITIDKYFNIDFMSLNFEEQLIILKYYCSFKTKYKTGEEILKKKRKV